MHWYEGSIAEAVALSKQRNAIFVVFIEGDNDLSAEMSTTIDHEDVIKRLADADNFLAIKLMSGSPNYTHFAQIYQFVPVPSLFFIGRNGTPLEVVCAGVQPASLATRIDRILQEHHKEKPQPQPSSSTQHLKETTVNLLLSEGNHSQGSGEASKPVTIPAEKAPDAQEPEPEASPGPSPPKQQKTMVEITKSGKEYDVVCEGDVCRRVPRQTADGAGPSSANVVIAEKKSELTPETRVEQPVRIASEADMEDKIEKAKELIEARRREKAAKEKELEKQKELERRQMGQGVTELKKWQADQELKQIQEERKREKLESNLARQRILEQIAQDRAERRARDVSTAGTHATSPTTQEQRTAGDGGTHTRIQFKLPDGTSHSAHFHVSGTLATVQQYVAENLQLSQSQFSLWTAFPRRELTQAEAELRALQLTPSAALLVLPRRQPGAVAAPTQLTSFIAFLTQIFTQFILEPTQQLYNWLYSRMFPQTPGGGQTPPERRVTPPERRVTPPAVPGGLRRRGNIHRLGENQQDDDNNTWNGNSTQQM